MGPSSVNAETHDAITHSPLKPSRRVTSRLSPNDSNRNATGVVGTACVFSQ